ncbi:MAG: hypothetical protein NC311_08740 [Muribaculaceae bacterium]|nr:hypothetical protein [Muribaculaceae bacterium]MCM1399862.1 hypothetical protein [Clostridium sp.]MCM1460653.1 hypothetical protein [Bacteroides sp.]
MRQVSDEWKESNARLQFNIIAELSSERVVTWGNSDILSITLNDATSSESSFDIGLCECKELTIKLDNLHGKWNVYDYFNAKIILSVSKELSEDVETVPLGVFMVDEPECCDGYISLNCVDYMMTLDKEIVGILSGTTVGDLVNIICDKNNLTLATKEFGGRETVIVNLDTTSMTYRDLLKYLMEVTCNFARLNGNGELEIKWYDTTKRAYEENDGIKNIEHNTNEKFNTDDVVITGVRVKTSSKTALYGKDDYVIEISDNPLTVGSEAAFAKSIGLRCIGMTFRGFSASTISDITVEAGDACWVKDKRNNIYFSYINSVTFTTGAAMSVACNAVSPLQNRIDKYSIAGQSNKKINEVRTELEKKNVAVVSYINPKSYEVREAPIKIAELAYTVNDDCKPICIVTVQFELDMDGNVEFSLYDSNGPIDYAVYTGYYGAGKNMATFMFFQNAQTTKMYTLRIFAKAYANSGSDIRVLSEALKNALNAIISNPSAPNFKNIYDTVNNAKLKAVIPELGAKAVVFAQGLDAHKVEWDGTLTIDENMHRIPITVQDALKVKHISGDMELTVQNPAKRGFEDTMGRVLFTPAEVQLRPLDYNMLITRVSVSKTITNSDMEPNEYITGDWTIKTTYELEGICEEIDVGYRYDVEIDKNKYDIEEIGVIVDEVFVKEQ